MLLGSLMKMTDSDFVSVLNASEKSSFTDEVLREVAVKTSLVSATNDDSLKGDPSLEVPEYSNTDQGQSSSRAVVPNLGRFVANLHSFMGLMVDKAKPQQVLIGDITEIEEAIKKEKVSSQFAFEKCVLSHLASKNLKHSHLSFTDY